MSQERDQIIRFAIEQYSRRPLYGFGAILALMPVAALIVLHGVGYFVAPGLVHTWGLLLALAASFVGSMAQGLVLLSASADYPQGAGVLTGLAFVLGVASGLILLGG